MTIFDIQMAVLRTRLKTKNENIGVSIKKGEAQVVEVIYKENGVSIVNPLSGWITLDDAILFLEEMRKD
jgi:hypothetical protein